MRHLGWLHATPKGSEKTRITAYKELGGEDHPYLELPDIESEFAGAYLVGLLYEAGLMSSSGMGPLPLSWTEINSWVVCTELELTVWEKLTIKRMSEEYVAERCETDPNRPAPYSRKAEEDEDLADEREKIVDKITSLLGAFIRRSDPADEADTSAEAEEDTA